MTASDPLTEPRITGRCYCGASRVTAMADPLTAAHCHCADCRRWTGAAMASFAAFAESQLTFDPPQGPGFSAVPGVTRWSCPHCGSPLAARFDYLPGQTYVPLGLLDQIGDLPPQMHCHADKTVPWLHIDDTLPRHDGSARSALNPE